MNSKHISLEIKGLLAGLAAALTVIGVTFGLAALVRSGTPAAASAPTPANSPPRNPSGSSSAVSAQIVQGRAFYTESCVVCHGVGGRGGDGPRLIGLGLTDPQIAETIRDGVKGDMPTFGQKYQQPQIQAMIAYIRSLKK